MISRDQVLRAFQDKLAEFGVVLSDPSRIELDGNWHRARVEGDRGRAENLSYRIHFDDRPAGFFEDHKRGFSGTFSVTNGEDLDPAERAAAQARWRAEQARREQEREQAYQEAAKRAQAALHAAPAASAGHPYLQRKGVVPGASVRVDEQGRLLIPVYTDFGQVCSYQTISADGEKLFMPGGRMAGAFHPINGSDKRRVLACEGYATGAALAAATGHSVACAMSAGNLPAVVRFLQRKFPDREIVACPDNDHGTAARTGKNPGLDAAAGLGVRVVAPAFPADADPKHTDWDDWLRGYGTARELVALINGPDAGQAEPDLPGEPAVDPPQLPDPAEPQVDPPATEEAPMTADQATDSAWPEPINLLGSFEPPIVRAEWLPESVVDYVFEQSDLIGADPSTLALSVIVACAAAIHDGIELQPKRHDPTWTEQARLWGAIVGDPSTRKTPVIKAAMSHLKAIDLRKAEESAGKLAEYEREMKVHKKREAAWINADAKGGPTGSLPEAPEAPPQERLIAEDITVEAMSNLLKDNDRGVLVINDELSGWFGAMDAYKGGGGKDRGLWLEIYNGGAKRVDRVMRGSILVPNWSASMLGGIQPEAIRRISAQLYDDGLMQRFMVVCGKPVPTGAKDRPANMDVIRGYRALLDDLYKTSPASEPVKLSPGAHEWRERMSAFSHGLAQAEILTTSFRAHLGKWDGLFARLLLVYHCIECRSARAYPTARNVSESTAKRVHDLMRYFLFPHAASFYMGVLARSERDSAAEWLAEWILADRREVVTLREVMQAYKRWRTLPDWQQRLVMRSLEDAGWIMADGETIERRVNRWAVNPKVHGLFGSQAKAAAERKQRSREMVREAFVKWAE